MTDVRVRALARPWLLAPLLLGLLAQNVVFLLTPDGPGGVAVKTALSIFVTVVVTTFFAELWIGDGRSVDPWRLLKTALVFLLPYPLLLAFGLVTTPFVYWILHADIPQAVSLGALYLVIGLGKLAAFALGATSSIAAARRAEASGAFGALRLGAGSVFSNLVFFFLLLGGFWLFQEAAVFLSRTLVPGPLAAFFTTAIPLLGCVAFPIEAWRSGRLNKA